MFQSFELTNQNLFPPFRVFVVIAVAVAADVVTVVATAAVVIPNSLESTVEQLQQLWGLNTANALELSKRYIYRKNSFILNLQKTLSELPYS